MPSLECSSKTVANSRLNAKLNTSNDVNIEEVQDTLDHGVLSSR